MKIGATTINSCKIGSTQVNEVRIGSTLVWSYSSFDPDAQLFITNAAIIDTTQQTAINQLVLDLKNYGIWTKMKALYPFVGGTAAQHKYNLRNPLDTDAAFRLIFNGGWAHSSTGALPNGTNTWANTFFVPLTSFNSQNDSHISYYSRMDTNGVNSVEMGVDNYLNKGLFIAPKFNGSFSAYRSVNSAQEGPGTSPNMAGMFIANRIVSTSMKLYKNGSTIFNDTISSVGRQNMSLIIGAFREVAVGGAARYFTDRQCALTSIGDGLTDTEAANFYTAVQAFQTTLSRQV